MINDKYIQSQIAKKYFPTSYLPKLLVYLLFHSLEERDPEDRFLNCGSYLTSC